MKNSIDEIFKSNLGNVQVPPSSHVKMGVAKQVSSMILKKTLIYVSLISSSTVALAITGKVLYDSYVSENSSEKNLMVQASAAEEKAVLDENTTEFTSEGRKTIADAEYSYLTSGDSYAEEEFFTAIYNPIDKCVDLITEEHIPNDIENQDQSAETQINITGTSETKVPVEKEQIVNTLIAISPKGDSYMDELTLYLPSNSEKEIELDGQSEHMHAKSAESDGDIHINGDFIGHSLVNSTEGNVEDYGLALQRENNEQTTLFKSSKNQLNYLDVTETSAENIGMIDVSILADMPYRANLLKSGVDGKVLRNVIPKNYKNLYNGWHLGLFGGVASLSELNSKKSDLENTTNRTINNSFVLSSAGFSVGRKLGKFTLNSGLGFQQLNQTFTTERKVIKVIETAELEDVYETVIIGGVSNEVFVGQTEVVTSEESLVKEITEHKTMIQYYSLPLNGEYVMLETPRFDLSFKAGVAYSKMAFAKGTVYDSDASKFMSIDQKSEFVNKGFFSTKLGIGVSTAVTKRVYLQVDPSFVVIRNGVVKDPNINGVSHSGMEMQVGLQIKL